MEERYEADLAQSQRVLNSVDRALERLSDGSYGSCEACGTPIRPEDLLADPARSVCEQHLAIGHAAN
jgi:RNA polymerase-binding transcription factor DksA